jgi:hypothetical protein
MAAAGGPHDAVSQLKAAHVSSEEAAAVKMDVEVSAAAAARSTTEDRKLRANVRDNAREFAPGAAGYEAAAAHFASQVAGSGSSSALPVAVVDATQKATSTTVKSEPRYDVITAPRETPLPAGALVLHDSSISKLTRRQTEVSGADAYTNRYGVAILQAMQQNHAGIGREPWALQNAPDELRQRYFELNRALERSLFDYERVLSLPRGNHEPKIAKCLATLKKKHYGADYIDQVYSEAVTQTEEEAAESLQQQLLQEARDAQTATIETLKACEQARASRHISHRHHRNDWGGGTAHPPPPPSAPLPPPLRRPNDAKSHTNDAKF